ncbi:hypothetical protein C8R43DRAFT_862041, partial [Mycena crocata]
PSLHAQSHTCLIQVSYMPALFGMADGEGVERAWAEVTVPKAKTLEMGPGTRHDVLDSVVSAFNCE